MVRAHASPTCTGHAPEPALEPALLPSRFMWPIHACHGCPLLAERLKLTPPQQYVRKLAQMWTYENLTSCGGGAIIAGLDTNTGRALAVQVMGAGWEGGGRGGGWGQGGCGQEVAGVGLGLGGGRAGGQLL